MRSTQKILLFLVVLTATLVSSCTSQPKPNTFFEDPDFRVDVLYDHTRLMKDYATPEELKALNLDLYKLNPTFATTREQKIRQLSESYHFYPQETEEERITMLEEHMGKLMIRWEQMKKEQKINQS